MNELERSDKNTERLIDDQYNNVIKDFFAVNNNVSHELRDSHHTQEKQSEDDESYDMGRSMTYGEPSS
jgi:parvulin-like peptidyl-prolyl isomerase